MATLRKHMLVSLVTSVLAVACSQLVSIPKAHADTMRTHDWNMAMSNEDYHYSGHWQDTVDIVAFLAAVEQPWSISLQEICKSQWTYLKNVLDDFGYNEGGYKEWNVNSSVRNEYCNRDGNHPDTSLGTAVFTRGPRIRGYWYQLQPAQTGNKPDVAVCSETQSWGFVYEGCSTHMTPGAPADDQAQDLWEYVLDTGNIMIVGGDFNFCHETPVTNNWLWTFAEEHLLSEPTTFNPGISCGYKIDFSWATRILFSKGTWPPCATYVNSNNGRHMSDHRHCRGVFTF